ncbi:MAG: penicillin-insensitive murein endopeptidase [Lentisphaeria bacterium]
MGYSSIARLAERTYVDSIVEDIIASTYKGLEQEQAAKVYKYIGTGYEAGGQFKLHKKHRNGLSVDFTTPVVDKDEKSVHFPTNPLSTFGYNIEFDKNSEYDGMSIDCEAIAAHIFFYITTPYSEATIYGA